MSQRAEIRSLTGLRGIAAVFVITYHLCYVMISNPSYNSLPIIFLRHGYLAVDLFFVLSGYVIALTHARELSVGFSVRAFADFLARRIGRVYPAYITVTAVVALHDATIAPRHGMVSGRMLIANALLMQSWGISPSIVGPGWSISTEFAAYLLFPLLVCAVLHRRQRWAWASAIAATVVVYFVATRSSAILHQDTATSVRHGPLDVYGVGTPFLLLRCLGGFTLGLIAYRLSQLTQIKSLASRAFIGDIAMASVLALMLIPNGDVAIVLMFVPLIVTLAEQRSLSAAFMSSPVVYWLGLISYSLYLVHQPMDIYLRRTMTNLLTMINIPHPFTLSAIALCIPILAVSVACYYGIEKPGRAWSRRLLKFGKSPNSSQTDVGIGAR